MQHDHILKKLFLFLYGGFLAPGAESEKNIFLIWSSGGHFVQRSETICTILVKGIIRNNSVKSFSIWTSGSRENDRGARVRASPASLRCVLEQDTLILA